MIIIWFNNGDAFCRTRCECGDSVALWEGGNIYALDEVKKTNKNNDKIKELDQLGRKFRPQGAILKVNMDQEHWLTRREYE